MKCNDVKERFSRAFHKSTDDAICALVNTFKELDLCSIKTDVDSQNST
jgi:hypothetical protein